MYRPTHFQLNERNAQLDFIRQNSFASLISCYQGQLEINQLPFLLDETGNYLLGHLAKNNSHWRQLEQADDLKVCFDGANAYISPNWYSDSKKNVPTWNFVSVQVSGKASLLSEVALIDLLDKLSQKHEAKFEIPWTIDKLSEQQLSAMSKAIIGIKVSIDKIEGKAKLSQNKNEVELKCLVDGLKMQKDFGSQQITQMMRELL